MLRLAFAFLVLALLAALLGFGGRAHGALEIARTLFYVFFAGFGVSFVAGLAGSRGSPRSTA